MSDLYFRYKQILDNENKKIVSSGVEDGFLVLDVIDTCFNQYKYFVFEEDGVMGAMVLKKI